MPSNTSNPINWHCKRSNCLHYDPVLWHHISTQDFNGQYLTCMLVQKYTSIQVYITYTTLSYISILIKHTYINTNNLSLHIVMLCFSQKTILTLSPCTNFSQSNSPTLYSRTLSSNAFII